MVPCVFVNWNVCPMQWRRLDRYARFKDCILFPFSKDLLLDRVVFALGFQNKKGNRIHETEQAGILIIVLSEQLVERRNSENIEVHHWLCKVYLTPCKVTIIAVVQLPSLCKQDGTHCIWSGAQLACNCNEVEYGFPIVHDVWENPQTSRPPFQR